MSREFVDFDDVGGGNIMSKTIVIVGFGPAVSSAVADKFANAGFSVGMVARRKDNLDAGVKALAAKGVKAAAFQADAGDAAAVVGAIGKLREALGPIAVMHWNASGVSGGGDLTTVEPAAAGALFNVSVVGLLAAVQAALPDLKAAGNGAVLITNGAYGEVSPQMDRYATKIGAAGNALANAAKRKLVGPLSERLKAEGVFVGEVTIAGAIRGTPFDNGTQTIEASAVADAFWTLFEERGEIRRRVAAQR
jgi:NADP-dependent 3-hydroxy acid dehydrogenase YdfG